ncbi:hypothetical protein [Azoarcus olearius]|uniref:hypothetical protein n=1 Tax=Azoarcus sp. (strain BH72) TaxID=418699 RepID=UPI0012ED9FF9|nr:hypothetical protein [Azoarcus olearius]
MPNEFQLNLLERDIQRQMKSGVDVDAAYMVYGAVRLLRSDVEGFEKAMENALRLSSSLLVRLNYAILLRTACRLSDSLKASIELAEKYPGDFEVLSEAARSASATLRYDLAERFIDMLDKLKAPEMYAAKERSLLRLPERARLRERMAESGLTYEDLAQVMEVASAVVARRFKIAGGWTTGITPDGTMRVTICVVGQTDDIVETSFEIADAVVAANLDHVGEVLTIACMGMPK